MQEAPKWLRDRQSGQGVQQRENWLQTSISRGGYALDVLDRLTLPSSRGTIDLCEIGAGREGVSLLCPCEPYRIAAHVENAGREYSLTIIDIDADVIDDIRTRKYIYLPVWEYENWGFYKTAWEQYLQETHQRDEHISLNTNRPDLLVYSKSQSLQRGIKSAQIPSSFAKKLADGTITLINDSIANNPLQNTRKYHFITAMNMMRLLTEQGQMNAMYAMSTMLADNGRILLDDSEFPGQPIFTKFGGWLNERMLKELHLSRDTVLKKDKNHLVLTLKKTE